MNKSLVRTSRFLSLVLRHRPESIGLSLDAEGWASVTELVRLASAAGRPLTRELLQEIVADNDKQRFTLSADGRRIRANQGHSVAVDLGLEPREPPPLLYHGTARRHLASILEQGLSRGRRHHVHLSTDAVTAHRVGQRHGEPVILVVDARALHEAGYPLYLSANGVWLSDTVPPRFLRVAADGGASP